MKVDLQQVVSVLAFGMLGWASLQVYQMNASVSLISYKVDENYDMIKPMWQDFLVRSARNDESWNDEFSSFNTSRKDK
jgi:hypothetical protein|tara:strand:- start:792 stop:1025 length:234 start_codon:yes stop_codon:yes gene_type:complete